jgi:hypothetical protein
MIPVSGLATPMTSDTTSTARSRVRSTRAARTKTITSQKVRRPMPTGKASSRCSATPPRPWRSPTLSTVRCAHRTVIGARGRTRTYAPAVGWPRVAREKRLLSIRHSQASPSFGWTQLLDPRELFPGAAMTICTLQRPYGENSGIAAAQPGGSPSGVCAGRPTGLMVQLPAVVLVVRTFRRSRRMVETTRMGCTSGGRSFTSGGGAARSGLVASGHAPRHPQSFGHAWMILDRSPEAGGRRLHRGADCAGPAIERIRFTSWLTDVCSCCVRGSGSRRARSHLHGAGCGRAAGGASSAAPRWGRSDVRGVASLRPLPDQ